MVRMFISGNKPESNRVIRCQLDFTAGKHAGSIPVEKKTQQHSGVIGLRASPAILVCDGAEVKLRNNINYESCEVTFRQPVLDRGGGSRYIVFLSADIKFVLMGNLMLIN